MKFKETIVISGSADKFWKLFDSGDSVKAWNPVFPEITGSFEVDSSLKIKLAYFARPPKVIQAKVTGYVQNKYLSFSYSTGPGSWWYQVEHIFRLAKNKQEELEFVNEIYAHGIRLRIGKLKFKSTFKKTLVKINEALKEQIKSL